MVRGPKSARRCAARATAKGSRRQQSFARGTLWWLGMTGILSRPPRIPVSRGFPALQHACATALHVMWSLSKRKVGGGSAAGVASSAQQRARRFLCESTSSASGQSTRHMSLDHKTPISGQAQVISTALGGAALRALRKALGGGLRAETWGSGGRWGFEKNAPTLGIKSMDGRPAHRRKAMAGAARHGCTRDGPRRILNVGTCAGEFGGHGRPLSHCI